ncbi:MAG: hypothetical protein HY698_03650 [Deltaproteobacteria bacterium]|nr:hypothetical protein [Deltaproteobacteria bacterium]
MKGCLGLVFIAGMVALACGSEQRGAPDEATMNKLVECQQERDRAKTATDMCTKQLDEAKSKSSGQEGGILVRIDGDTLNIMGKPSNGAGGEGTITDADALKLTEEFNAQVRGSKNSIQQCYVSALKKNESIQARQIKLAVRVTATSSGRITSPAFSPSISPDFKACMEKIASRWKVASYQGSSVQLEYPVTLTPAE